MHLKSFCGHALAAALSTLALAGNASAAVACNTLNDASGNGISISECNYVNNQGSYTVTNGSTTIDITAFAVSTKAPANTTSYTTRTGWKSFMLTEADWNSQVGSTLGLFDDLFGTADTGAFVYTKLDGATPNPILHGTTASGFYYGSTPNSNFIALGANSQIVARSLAAPTATTTPSVPEPATLALVAAAALAGVSARRRRA